MRRGGAEWEPLEIGPELCISDRYDPRVCGVRAAWQKRVQAHVPLIRCLGYANFSRWEQVLPRVLAEGYDGLCTYESNDAVLDPRLSISTIRCARIA